LRGPKAHRPASIAKSAPAKDHAGFGGIHPKDRDDASDRADQQGRCAAQPLVNQLGDQNLVGGRSSNCFGLVPGQQLRAIALADPFDQGLPVGELLSRWWWRLDRHSHRLTRAAAFRPSTWLRPAPHNCARYGGVEPAPKKAFCIYWPDAQSIYYLLIAASASARAMNAIVIEGRRSSGCCGPRLSPSPSGKTAPP
jgi:hypothetical protein